MEGSLSIGYSGWCGVCDPAITLGEGDRDSMIYLPYPGNKKQKFALPAVSRVPYQHSSQESVQPPKTEVELVTGRLVLKHTEWMPSSPEVVWYNFPGAPRSSRNGDLGLPMAEVRI